MTVSIVDNGGEYSDHMIWFVDGDAETIADMVTLLAAIDRYHEPSVIAVVMDAEWYTELASIKEVFDMLCGCCFDDDDDDETPLHVLPPDRIKRLAEAVDHWWLNDLLGRKSGKGDCDG